MVKLSGLLITRDSAPWLAQVLTNMRAWADEVVVVVDLASTDDTYQVARCYADRVQQWVVGGYLEKVLHYATALCHGAWIMRLDDDELMPPDFRASADYLMAQSYDDFVLNRLHLVGDGGQRADTPTTWPDPQVRLRSAEICRLAPWPTKIHAWPNFRNRCYVRTAATTIWHLHYLLREQPGRVAATLRYAAASGVDPRNCADAGPWRAVPAPTPAPVELPAMLAALGRPCYPLRPRPYAPETFMRALRGTPQIAGLHELIALLPDEAQVVEVGAFAGEATRLFAASAKVVLVSAVDTWDFAPHADETGGFTAAEVETAFDRLLRDYPHVEKVKEPSPQAAAGFPDGSCDLVYLDADHSYPAVTADIAAWRPKVKPGGILAGHDGWAPGVIRAVREALGQADGVCSDGSWWVRC